ncbi:Glucose dehydrogenase -like protein [Halotydeus destructor]|nr:Glucose dehydrogenase -like protein [Halotydeus destructor]
MDSGSFLSLLLALGQELWSSDGQVRSVQSPLASYDYIIVGAGGAGAVLAARLSQDPSKLVLLIEAGGSSNRAADVPYTIVSWQNTLLSRQLYSVKQQNVCRQDACLLPTGRLLGGTTAINCMRFVRGNRADFDGYATNGLPSWAFDKVLPFFKKLENSVHYKSQYRGDKGPINVTTSQWPYLDDLSRRWTSAGQELFGSGSRDYNGQFQKGFSLAQRSTYRGIRESTDRAYLQPLDQKRSNLHVLTFSHVTKVIFTGKRATGVQYQSVRDYDKNARYTVNAKLEVILSAGVFGSPQILMLSGIGPQAHLHNMGIRVLADRPGVGQNLLDSIQVQVNFRTNQTYPNTGHVTGTTYREWLTKGTGVLSSNQVVGMAFLPSMRSSSYDDDVRAMFTFNFDEPKGDDTALRVDVTYYNIVPSTRGYLKLRSNDPLDQPIIDPKYLSADGDLEEAIGSFRDMLKLSDAKALKEIAMKPIEPSLGSCGDPWTESYITCYIREFGFTSNQQAGTCKMGNSSDPMAVVDDQLRVHGVKGLRVVDASIFPTTPRGGVAAPAMMVGEVAASFIASSA